MTSLLIKESVNQSVDNMGFHNALQSAFTIHQLNHAHWAVLSGGARATGSPEFGLPDWRQAPEIKVSRRDRVLG
jgi:enoyl-CoA hydratase